MSHRIWIALSLAALTVFPSVLVSCTGPDRPSWASWNPENWSNRSDADDPVLLDVAGPVAVDVESFNGDVYLQADPDLQQARVTLVREAIHGHERVKEAKASLAHISMTAEIVPGELGQALQVRTTTVAAEPHFQRAHLFIELPEINGVRVSTTNGKVHVRNTEGAMDIETTEGDVRVMTNQRIIEPVTILNRNGDIDYRVRGESTAQIDAQTVNGRVLHHARYGNMVVAPTTADDRLHATLNRGKNPLTLRTVNGDIRIAVVHNPEEVGDIIID